MFVLYFYCEIPVPYAFKYFYVEMGVIFDKQFAFLSR